VNSAAQHEAHTCQSHLSTLQILRLDQTHVGGDALAQIQNDDITGDYMSTVDTQM